jgi:hypothetical protein
MYRCSAPVVSLPLLNAWSAPWLFPPTSEVRCKVRYFRMAGRAGIDAIARQESRATLFRFRNKGTHSRLIERNTVRDCDNEQREKALRFKWQKEEKAIYSSHDNQATLRESEAVHNGTHPLQRQGSVGFARFFASTATRQATARAVYR